MQAKAWGKNPVQLAIKWLRTKPDGWKVADFGCGDAQIAQELCKTHRVLSFDLYSNNRHVTACNMASVPCDSGAQHSSHLVIRMFVLFGFLQPLLPPHGVHGS